MADVCIVPSCPVTVRALEEVTVTAYTPPEALVAALGDPAWAGRARAEIWRRLVAGNKANRLCVELLVGNEMPRYSRSRGWDTPALDGLCAICWRALRGLRLGASVDCWRSLRHQVWEETREFIGEVISKQLGKYNGEPEASILLRGLRGEFRHVPRVVQLRLIDEIRRRKAKKRTHGAVLSLDFKVGEGKGDWCYASELFKGPGDLSSTLGRRSYGECLPDCGIGVEKLIEIHVGDLLKSLGRAGFETLVTLAQMDDDELKGTKREVKGATTRAIAARRGVSLRKARRDKKRLTRGFQKLDGVTREIVGHVLARRTPTVRGNLPRRRVAPRAE